MDEPTTDPPGEAADPTDPGALAQEVAAPVTDIVPDTVTDAVTDAVTHLVVEPLTDVTTVVPERRTHDGLGAMVDRFDDAVDRLWGRLLRGRPAVDRTFYLASELGDFSLIWHLIGAAQGLRSDRDADATVRLAAVLLVESLVVNQGIKRLVRRPRPQPTEPRPHHLRMPLTSSFPSGHASSAFTAAGVLSAHDPALRPLYYAVAAVVATSRVHVQIHHASDVIAGAALGAVFARLAVRAWPLPTR